jgi:hypothetical protein
MGKPIKCPHFIFHERGIPPAVCGDNGFSLTRFTGTIRRNRMCNYQDLTNMFCEIDSENVDILGYEEKVQNGDDIVRIPIKYIKR